MEQNFEAGFPKVDGDIFFRTSASDNGHIGISEKSEGNIPKIDDVALEELQRIMRIISVLVIIWEIDDIFLQTPATGKGHIGIAENSEDDITEIYNIFFKLQPLMRCRSVLARILAVIFQGLRDVFRFWI